MSHEVKPCPRCGGHAVSLTPNQSHYAHGVGHALHSGHPLMALLGLTVMAGQKLMGKSYRCRCGHQFHA